MSQAIGIIDIIQEVVNITLVVLGGFDLYGFHIIKH